MRIIAVFSNPAHCRIEYIELNWIYYSFNSNTYDR